MEKRICVFLIVVFVTGIIVLPFARAQVNDSSENLEIVNNFALLDQNGKFQELFYYSDMKALLIIHVQSKDLLVPKFIEYLRELTEAYSKSEIKILMLASSDDRDFIKKELVKQVLDIAVLLDPSKIVTDSLSMTMSGQTILIRTRNWSIVHRGFFSKETSKLIDHGNIKSAINQILSNEEVVASWATFEGYMSDNDDGQDVSNLSYVDDVVPILINKCLTCHHLGGSAPWAMTDFHTIRGWGAMIREVLRTRRMPPYQPDSHNTALDMSEALSSEELRVLVKWIENGMEYGQGNDPLKEAEVISPFDKEPDLIIKSKGSNQIPPTGIYDYQYQEAEDILPGGVWLHGFEAMQSNFSAVHHMNTLAVPLDMPYELTHEWYENNRNLWLAAYCPGKQYVQFPENTGRYFSNASRVLFESHYTTTGKPETDIPKFGLYIYEKPPKYLLKTHLMQYHEGFNIPPGVRDFKLQLRWRVSENIKVLRFIPHMHFRGKRIRLSLEDQEGNIRVLANIPDFNFSWQMSYDFAGGLEVEKGMTFILDSVYDNSSQNRRNPDSNQTVSNGAHSDAEMLRGVFAYHELQDVDSSKKE